MLNGVSVVCQLHQLAGQPNPADHAPRNPELLCLQSAQQEPSKYQHLLTVGLT
jgi:hypothetical protein